MVLKLQKSNRVFKKIKKKKKEDWGHWVELADLDFWNNKDDEVWTDAKAY
ncbi:MAG: hypothetical protein Q7S92_06175 [Candidatus Diapherotrites archaeon]|nr:hypothetical protein [Candidatus Diapherotrites archaeon]